MTFNIEGFHRNNFYLTKLLNRVSPKLIFLQEIWTSYSEQGTLDKLYPEYSIQISTPDMFTPAEDLLGRSDQLWHGAGIMWHSSLSSNTSSLKTINERFTSLRITVENNKFLVLSV